MNAPSYDKRMEGLPVFISYPRSGSNWVNSVMEVYFNRPRLRRGAITFLSGEALKKPPMWFHDHDYLSKLKLGHNNVLYLYRNPDDVIFSSLKSEHNGTITDKTISIEIFLLKNNLSKYLLSAECAKVIVKYENMKANLTEFQNVISWLNPGVQIDMDRINLANKIVNKRAVVAKSADKRFFGQKLLSDAYENEQKAFKKQYGNHIVNNVITPELKRFF